MNILSQKVDEIEWLGQELGKQFLSKPGSLEKNKSQIFANKKLQKIAVLILSQSELEIKAYSVDLKHWVEAEELGLSTDEIMKNLVVVRMFGISHPQTAELQGNIFAELPLDSVEDYLVLNKV